MGAQRARELSEDGRRTTWPDTQTVLPTHSNRRVGKCGFGARESTTVRCGPSGGCFPTRGGHQFVAIIPKTLGVIRSDFLPAKIRRESLNGRRLVSHR